MVACRFCRGATALRIRNAAHSAAATGLITPIKKPYRPQAGRCINVLTGVLFLLAGLSGLQASAGIIYDSAADVIAVNAFPEEWPCTPARLAAMDRACGWNKVEYDPATGACIVHAGLEIGGNDGSDTYFQLGSPHHPRETLVVHGNVVIRPYWIKDANPGLWYTAARSVNRLTLGCPDNTNIMPVLKIASSPQARRTLLAGVCPGREAFGGQLHVHGGAITALTPDAAHRLGAADQPALGMILRADEVILRNAELSWIDGIMCYGAQEFAATRDLQVKFECWNTRFTHGGTALADHGRAVIRNCTFDDLDCAIRDYGGINLVIENCVFQNNGRNWELIYSDKGLTAVDCSIMPGRGPDRYRCWLNPAKKVKQFPRFKSERHIIVEVTDTAGNPIPKAQVSVRAVPHNPACVENGLCLTDAAGRTPGAGQARAIRLLEYAVTATESNSPDIVSFRYEIAALAEGYQPIARKDVTPDASWRVYTLRLPVK